MHSRCRSLLLIALVLLVAAPALAAGDLELLHGLAGRWQGELSYRDYQDDSRQSIPMTVVHVAGALGIPCDVILLPWLEGFEDTQDRLDWSFGAVCPWYNSVTIHRSLDGWKTAQSRKQDLQRRKTG